MIAPAGALTDVPAVALLLILVLFSSVIDEVDEVASWFTVALLLRLTEPLAQASLYT